MRMRRVISIIALSLGIALLTFSSARADDSAAAGAVAPSGVMFRFVNEQAQPVELKNAKLLLVAWGYVDVIDLSPAGDRLFLPCDADWLRKLAPERFHDLEAVYLYLDAEGYMKKRAERIKWPGTLDNESGTVTISVPGGAPVSVAPGENKTMPVVFRKPGRRFLRMVDEDGAPVAGIHVDASMFWSQSNHCGRLAGAWKQAEGVSDKRGIVEVPDGEYEYVFELGAEGPTRFALAHPENSAFPRRIVTHLTEETTDVTLKLWKERPLVMRVTRGGEPVNGLTFQGCLSEGECIGGVCGTCCGPFGTTDKDGIIIVPEFYPENWSRIFVPRETPEGAEPEYLYEADPNDWPAEGVIEVKLPADAEK